MAPSTNLAQHYQPSAQHESSSQGYQYIAPPQQAATAYLANSHSDDRGHDFSYISSSSQQGQSFVGLTQQQPPKQGFSNFSSSVPTAQLSQGYHDARHSSHSHSGPLSGQSIQSYPASQQSGPAYHGGHGGSLPSRNESSAPMLAMGPGSSMDGDGAGNFTLASTQDQFSLRGVDGPRSHAFRSNDDSSVASSMIAQGVGPPSSASYRTGPNADAPAPVEHTMLPEADNSNGEKIVLDSPEEIEIIRVFVEHVGVWMDSLDKSKHFSRILPYIALKSPMLLNAYLACGVKHISLNNNDDRDDKALSYYNTATMQLLRSLSNPDRNTAECATTATVLNVYEVMSERRLQRMNHIAGARALIRECGWDATSTGIGAACFWLNIGMELLSCMAMRDWHLSWDPDKWGLDLSFLRDMATGATAPALDTTSGHEQPNFGDEEVWVHRMLYIMAKTTNFRASIPKFQASSAVEEAYRQDGRLREWTGLKSLCDAWANHCPRSMRPFAYRESSTTSLFPQVWLIKRAAIVGRLFFHTAMALLHEIHPTEPADSHENEAARRHHARQVCGIIAHTKDNGITSVSICSLAIAAASLRDIREQEEVMNILTRINRETGWKLGRVTDGLIAKWGWPRDGHPAVPSTLTSAAPSLVPPIQLPPATGPVSSFPSMSRAPQGPSSMPSSAPVAQPTRRVNPMLVNADFSEPNHVYQGFYVPPDKTNMPHMLSGYEPPM
jgi:hypothetical protein